MEKSILSATYKEEGEITMNTRIVHFLMAFVLCAFTQAWSQSQNGGFSSSSSKSDLDQGEMETQIIPIEYYPISDLERLIRDIFGIDEIHQDRHSNRLIINAPANQMNKIKNLISQLDVPDIKTKDTSSLILRIYMFETPNDKNQWKDFSLVVLTLSNTFTTALLKTLDETRMQISDIIQLDER